MLVIFEISRPFQLKPFCSRMTLGGKRNLRVGWLCFAVAIYRHSLHDFGKLLKKPDTRWRE